jgi:hypothetical protein
MGGGLLARAAFAVIAWALWRAGVLELQQAPGAASTIFVFMRWGMGFVGPLLATVLAWKTVQLRSTQSATGILYAAVALVTCGELTAVL